MKLIIFIILIFISECKPDQGYIRMQCKTDTLWFPDGRIRFESNKKDWKAILFSPVQPLPMNLQYHASGFTAIVPKNTGTIEGLGKLVCISGSKKYFFNIVLKNRVVTISGYLYTAPKYIQVDSSISQQRIWYKTDQYSNLMLSDSQDACFFDEEIINTSRKAGIYTPIKQNPITAYYILSGATKLIPIQVLTDANKKLLHVIAGPLKDKYGNVLQNGTLAHFFYTSNDYLYRTEKSVNNGYAEMFVRQDSIKNLYVTINNVYSKKIKLATVR